MNRAERDLQAIAELDALTGADPEMAHVRADKILLELVDPAVKAAYERVMSRCPWWACA